MEVQFTPLETQSTGHNTTANNVRDSKQKQTEPGQKNFQATLEEASTQKQPSVKAEDNRDDLQEEITVNPINNPVLPLAIAPLTVVFSMPGNQQSALESAESLKPAESLGPSVNLPTVAVETTAIVADGWCAAEPQALSKSTGPVISAMGAVDTERNSASSMVSTDLKLTTGNLEQAAMEIKPKAVVETEQAPVVNQVGVTLEAESQVISPAPELQLPNPKDIKTVADVKYFADVAVDVAVAVAVAVKPIVSLTEQKQELLSQVTQAVKSPDPTAREVTFAPKEAFAIVAAPLNPSGKDEGSQLDLAQSSTPVAIPVQGKTEFVTAAFPEIEAPQPVKEQVLQQIIQKASLLTTGGQHEIKIQLKPDYLGPLNLLIAVENGVVTAKFHTDSYQTKQLLEASMSQLKQDLQAQGLKVQQVDVYVGQQGMTFSDFSRQGPNYNLLKSKRLGKIAADDLEQQFSKVASTVDSYGGLLPGGVDYRV